MPEEAIPFRCRHVFTEGRQCGSPALRGEKLCYYHHGTRRPLPRRPEDSFSTPILPAPEDLHAIQRALGEVLRLIATGQIADAPARLLLSGLATASVNLARIARQERAARLDHLKARADALRLNLKARAQGLPELAPHPPAELVVDLVHDLVHDPLLGTLAPGPEPVPRPNGPIPVPTVLLVPTPAGPTCEETAAVYARVEQATAARRQARHEERRQLAETYAATHTPEGIDPGPALQVQPYLLSNERLPPSTLKIPEDHHRSTRQLDLPDCAPFLHPPPSTPVANP